MSYPNQPPAAGDHNDYGATHTPHPDTAVGQDWPSGAAAATTSADPAGGGTAAVKDVAGTAKDEAMNLASTASHAGGHVVETAKQEAADVIEEVKFQGRQLLDESMLEFRAQAGTGQHKIAELARALGSELETLTQADPDGMLSQYLDQAQRLSSDAASWLDSREPDEVLDSVRSYAARNPMQFLAISAGIGFIGARIYRGLQAAKADQQQRNVAAPHGATPTATSYAPDDGYSLATPGSAAARPASTATGSAARYQDLAGDPDNQGWETR